VEFVHLALPHAIPTILTHTIIYLFLQCQVVNTALLNIYVRNDASQLRDGQLILNTFSRSSRFTTCDGSRLCDIATLEFSADSGVAPGQEGQHATLVCNAIGETCGVVMEEEDDCVARMVGRSCHLVLLSRSVPAEGETWDNYLVVAENNPEYFERVTVVRIMPKLLGPWIRSRGFGISG
jgi:hypothetical protein